MKGKITVVSLVVLLLAAVAWVMTIGGVTARSDSTGAFAVGLAAHTDQITRIELDRESKKFVLVRAADGLWRVETSGGYLASTAQVAGLGHQRRVLAQRSCACSKLSTPAAQVRRLRSM